MGPEKTETTTEETDSHESDASNENLEENDANSLTSLEDKSDLIDVYHEEKEAKNEIEIDHISITKPPSILKILCIAAVSAGLVVSVLINISLLSNGGEVNSSISSFQWVVITGALLITALSLGVSFWLYYVRSIYLKDGPALVPEKWGILIAELSRVTNQSNVNTVEKLTSLIGAISNQSIKSETLLESFLTLQATISNRDEEINRLKKGHDTKIFKRFIMRFVRVSNALQEIRDEAQDSDQAKNYKYLCRLIQNALEECGVEQLSPEIGTDYRQLGSEVDDDPKIIETNDELKNFHIASVESLAYIIQGEGGREIILPASVSIYRSKEEGVTTDV